MQEQLIGKRVGRRIKLRLPARLVMPERAQQVWIVDLSDSGVALEMVKTLRSSSGMLMWLGYRTLVDLVWHEEGRCGFRFAKALDKSCLERSVRQGLAPAPIDAQTSHG